MNPPATLAAPIRIFILDDHGLFTTVLVQILARSGDFNVVGTASNGTEALEKLAVVEAELVLVDLILPGMSGIEFIQALRARGSRVKIVVCSGVTTDRALETALALGALAFVEKSASVEELLVSLRAVAKGEFPMSPRVAAALRKIVQRRNGRKPLASGDLEILRRLARGEGTKQIAAEANLSLSAIYKARRRIAERTGAVDHWDLRSVALGLGLLHEGVGMMATLPQPAEGSPPSAPAGKGTAEALT
jgi:DNA-binding NarL/FixJ family response regulator